MPDTLPPRVIATEAALRLLDAIRADHGPVLFHQSGGCCDGSAQMCYPSGEFRVGDRDVRLGAVGGAEVWMGAALFDYWRHSQLILDAGPGSGGAFSLDNGRGQRFVARSRVFTDAECAALEL
jgi:uncharacterized protein